ncbi:MULTISPECIES: DUF7674 family protein [Sporomusa]|uniref:DUF7674 domain-containing protein n=1 Tax=Sporomusa sphaeroides DSM 2875 TaxID=1337886 RepID=A0ABP2CBB7_9FIRM|nr:MULTISPECIES: hypothetical protein [Sporomusa]OLS54852.1 hypothetical protein SPSPH_41850 [Sporomusa sphaeroides DSM 2875]CVK21606.1 hypothetical protein SSPH_04298 [Sporomusa sphaeroides DSM 2875]
MTYDSLVRELIVELPEFQEAYEKEVEWWDGQEPSPHNFFGDVVTPYLLNLLNKEKNEEITTRIFRFFTDMASSEDVKIQEVLAQSVLERLGDEKVLLAKAYPFMSDNVRKLSREAEKFWGR